MKSQTISVPSQMSLTQLSRKSLLALSSRHVYRENIIEMWILHRSDALQLKHGGWDGGPEADQTFLLNITGSREVGGTSDSHQLHQCLSVSITGLVPENKEKCIILEHEI